MRQGSLFTRERRVVTFNSPKQGAPCTHEHLVTGGATRPHASILKGVVLAAAHECRAWRVPLLRRGRQPCTRLSGVLCMTDVFLRVTM